MPEQVRPLRVERAEVQGLYDRRDHVGELNLLGRVTLV
jgi:hypothetical protein